MRSAAECRERAQECRALADRLDGDRREHTLRMAETWEGLAREVECSSSSYLSGMLKASYDKVAEEPVPEIFRTLLKQLEAAEPRNR